MRTPLWQPLLALAGVAALACSGAAGTPRATPPAVAATPTPALASLPSGGGETRPLVRPPMAAPKPLPVVVFLGDSISAGLGVDPDQAFPAVVSRLLAADGLPIRALNAGVSGDTSAGGLRRLPWLLRQRPDVLVVELGANDGLRGQPVAALEANLRQIVTRAGAAGARVLLVGMRVPPSLGSTYADDFAAVYPRLARQLGVPLLPFLLEGVAGSPELNQGDGIHPNAEGHRRVAEGLRPALESIVGGLRPEAARRR